jgi:hypothetical protein
MQIPNYMCEIMNVHPCLNVIINEHVGAIVYNDDRMNMTRLSKFNKPLEDLYQTIDEFLKNIENNKLVYYKTFINEKVDSVFYNKDNYKDQDIEKYYDIK